MPPPLTRLERMVLEADYDFHQGSLDAQCERVRAWLRSEIRERATPVAVVEPVEIDWGRVLDNFGPEGIAALTEELGVSAPAEFAALTA